MKEPEAETPKRHREVGTGFRVSAEPVVESSEQTEEPAGDWAGLPYAIGDLYLIARNPKSLFACWNVDSSRGIAEAVPGRRPIHLRVFREDGTEETATKIDPMLGYAFADVSSPGVRYICELGCFDGDAWKTLVRSGSTETPEAAMSDDLGADFATLPFHLSFQRLIDIFNASTKETKTLSESVAGMQNKARTLQASMSAADWSKLVDAASDSVNAGAGFGLSGVSASELAALLRTVKCDRSEHVPSPEQLARLRALSENVGGSSWGGAS